MTEPGTAGHLASGELSCQEFVELVTDYVEGALVPDERVRFEAHLAACDGCETYLEQMRQSLVIVGRLREESIAPDVQEGLMAAFRAWKQDRDVT